MTTETSHPEKLRVIIAGGGVAALETALALRELRLWDWWRVARLELASGLTLGLILGVIGFARIAVWSEFTPLYGPHWLLVAATVSTAAFSSVCSASCAATSRTPTS